MVPPVASKHTAAAIEHQIVVAAELIHVGDRHTVTSRHAAEHLFAEALLAGDEGRRREIEDGLRAGANQLLDRVVMVAPALPEVAVVPDVLTDADAEPHAADVEHLRAVERLEVAVFVEDVVGGQQRFAESVLDFAATNERGGVEERPPFVGRIRLRQPDEDRWAVGQLPRQHPATAPSCAARSLR